MQDISGAEFEVGDALKVIKEAKGLEFNLGDVLKCMVDDGTSACIFANAATGVIGFYHNNHLQKL